MEAKRRMVHTLHTGIQDRVPLLRRGLRHHRSAESVAHVRIDECKTCERYLKTVDLRVKGDAIPLVEEVATVELDLWARDRGMTKLRANVLGL